MSYDFIMLIPISSLGFFLLFGNARLKIETERKPHKSGCNWRSPGDFNLRIDGYTIYGTQMLQAWNMSVYLP